MHNGCTVARSGSGVRRPDFGRVGGATVATFQQNYNPFVRKLMVDFTMDPYGRLDRRLGLAAATLLSAIEGRQS